MLNEFAFTQFLVCLALVPFVCNLKIMIFADTPMEICCSIVVPGDVHRPATKFICNDRNMNYQIRLVHLNLLPFNYWLEYLDLLFFYKCKSGIILLNLENFVKYRNSKSRRGSS